MSAQYDNNESNPPGSRSTASRHFFPAVALPHFAFNFFMAVLVRSGGVATDRLQLLHGGVFLASVALPWLTAAMSYRNGIPTVRGQVLHGGTFFSAVASPRFAVNSFMAALLLRWHRHGHSFFFFCFLRRWHPHGSRSSSSWRHLFSAVASPRFAVNSFMAALLLRWHRHGHSFFFFAFAFYGGGIPTVRGQVLHGGTFFPRWHPHGSRLTPSWRHFYCDGIATGTAFFFSCFLRRWHPHGSRSSSSWRHLFSAVASPRFAVNSFMAALLLRWHRHGHSFFFFFLLFTAVASPRFAVKFFMAAPFFRGGIPTVRG